MLLSIVLVLLTVARALQDKSAEDASLHPHTHMHTCMHSRPQEMAGILSHPLVYSFLHLPVQCGSDSVLADMKRDYTVADFRHVVDFLKDRCVDTHTACCVRAELSSISHAATGIEAISH